MLRPKPKRWQPHDIESFEAFEQEIRAIYTEDILTSIVGRTNFTTASAQDALRESIVEAAWSFHAETNEFKRPTKGSKLASLGAIETEIKRLLGVLEGLDFETAIAIGELNHLRPFKRNLNAFSERVDDAKKWISKKKPRASESPGYATSIQILFEGLAKAGGGINPSRMKLLRFATSVLEPVQRLCSTSLELEHACVWVIRQRIRRGEEL